MDIQIYNTLSKNKEVFKPLKAGAVGMYHCGPTVYDRAHIGNLRAYVFADTLRRMFEYNGYAVKQIINITDVGHLSGENAGNADQGEDKMTKALIRENMPLTLAAMREVATKYFDAFVEDLKELHIELPHAFPRASDTIQEDIEFIKQLEKKGFVYQIKDGVYFDTSKFPSYGKLGGIDHVELAQDEAHARIAENTEKKNYRDFAVWKLSAKHNVGEEGVLIGWDSPWGKGFPGWHIECSVMSKMELGQPFDIHTGGIDHIPVHHNNEIAQSEAAYGVSLAQYWMHNAFITIKKAKMAKSEGNFITLDTLEQEHISPLAYRYWLLTGHYRSPLNFTNTAIQSAQKALIRLLATVSGYPDGGVVLHAYKERFQAFINDDLDIPQALALVWDIIKDKQSSPADKRATILDFDRIFGLGVESVPHVGDVAEVHSADIPVEITALAEAREEARKAKEWAKADALRTEIQDRGFDVIDGEHGFSIITR
ncbi:MAG TPA: cysteine--tRNA ligase [Candidatus Paceibacterota bacterium]|nr:cysteine--tRNA ligase [Candidatus Paceibacterota bacterium]